MDPSMRHMTKALGRPRLAPWNSRGGGKGKRMTDDLSWSAGPRRSADRGVSARHARTVDPAPTRGRRSLPETDFDPEPARRGARRFADPEPTQWHEPDRSPFDGSRSSQVESRRHQEIPHLSRPEPTRPEPRPEPISDFWSVAEARSRASAIEVEPELPKHTTPEPDPTSSPLPLPENVDEKAENEKEVVPTRAVRPDFLGRLKRIGLVTLTGILIFALGFTAWSWVTRGTWEFVSLWPFGASTSPESPNSPAPDPAASSDPESTEGARPADSEQVLDDTSFTVPTGWKEYGEDQPPAEPDRRVVRLQHSETDVRLQVTSLVEIPEGKDLLEACKALSTSQQTRFSTPIPTPTSQDKVSQAQGGSYTTCGFAGVRTENQVPSTVMFTFLLRTSDGHVLILRSIIPDSVGGGSAARQELAGMNCTASLNFGIALPLC